MKYYFVLFILLTTNIIFTQRETEKWIIRPNSLLDFSGASPILTNMSVGEDFIESSSCISDENGNLLFYSDGETVWDANNNVLPNGNNLTSSNTPILSTTQGSIFVNKPESDNQYYLFSLAPNQLSYSVLDKTLNGGLGAVVSKQNILIKDTLTEKMAVAKHCNNRDYWLVVVKIKYKSLNYLDYTLEFLSYLVTKNGVKLSPIISNVNTTGVILGQMKFNNVGNELAYAEKNALLLFHFNSSSGVIGLKKKLNYL
jgi:hypothetical protein